MSKDKVTMKLIANKLGLSINAVSIALNNKEGISERKRMEILKLADKLGYLDKFPYYKPSFANKNVCVILQSMYFKDAYFYSKILIGIEEESRINHYNVIINFYEDGNFAVPNCIENRKVSGIIIVGNIRDEYLIKIKQFNIPIVLVDHSSLLVPTDSIMSDNKLGSYIATEYLVHKGFLNIGFFGDLNYSLSINERFFGFHEALKNNMNFENSNLLNNFIADRSVLYDTEDFVINSDIDKIIEIIKQIKIIPDAFICSNDSAALHLIKALNSIGYSIPNDISIIGFDDIVLSTLISPKLTTIMVNKELMGKKAVDKLIFRMKNKEEPVENTILSVKLIERDSVATRSII